MTELQRAVFFRIDRTEKLSTGFLRVTANLTKAGVFDYKREDKVIKELRSPGEVFSQSSLDTLRDAPVTVDHPSQWVDIKNAKTLQVGYVTSVEVEKPYVVGTIVVNDANTVSMIENGHLKELSCGYNMELVALDPHSTSGGASLSQTNIRYNHAALGPSGFGRLGSDVCLRLDSNNNQMVDTMTDKTEETVEAVAVTDEQPKADKAQDIVTSMSAQLAEILERMTAKETEDAAYTEPDEIKSIDDLERDIKVRVDNELDLELRARNAFLAVFPKRVIQPKRCARQLSEAVIRHVDSAFEVRTSDSLDQLIERAELVAKTSLKDAEPPKLSELRKALQSGVPPLREDRTSLRARILDK
jgi:hypothetical protein